MLLTKMIFNAGYLNMFNNINEPKPTSISLQKKIYNQINFKHENSEILELIDSLDIKIKHFTLGDKRLFPNAIIACDTRWNGLHINIRLKFKIGVEATSEYHSQCEFHKYGGIMRLGWIFSGGDKRIIEEKIYSLRGHFTSNDIQHVKEMEFMYTGKGKHKLIEPKSVIITNPTLDKPF